MRNLNVDFTEADKPKEQKKLDKFNEWANPVGWWNVTTEGDVEGRTTRRLGAHYGHIADIALTLADQTCYSLQFEPAQVIEPGIEVKRKATSRSANISFRGGPLSGRDPNTKDVYLWMNIHGINVKDCNYYGAITIEAMKG